MWALVRQKKEENYTVINAQLPRNCMAHQAGQTYDTQVKLGHSAIHNRTNSDLDKPSTYTDKDFYTTLLQ